MVDCSNRSWVARFGLALTGVLVGTLLVPAIMFAQSEDTGTLTGSVACGETGQPSATPSALVSIEGMDLSTRADETGQFTLIVPALVPLTVDALISPNQGLMASREDVTVQPGETLDIGQLNVTICPEPAVPTELPGPGETQQQTQDNPND